MSHFYVTAFIVHSRLLLNIINAFIFDIKWTNGGIEKKEERMIGHQHIPSYSITIIIIIMYID